MGINFGEWAGSAPGPRPESTRWFTSPLIDDVSLEFRSSTDFLLLVQLPPRIQVIEIQNRVEDQEVASLRLSAPERVG